MHAGLHDHRYPTCFVCGPERAQGDGLRIFTGPVEDKSLVATVEARALMSPAARPRRDAVAATDAPATAPPSDTAASTSIAAT